MDSKNGWIKAYLPCFFTWTVLASAVLMPQIFSESVRDSLRTCFEKLIPSVFTFAVLSEYLSENGELPHFLTDGIGRLWGFGRDAAKAAFFALFAGFPIGALSAGELLREGRITKNEAERLVGFTSNAGLSFLLGFVGIGLFGNVRAGVCLFVSQTLASVLLGLVFAPHERLCTCEDVSERSRRGLVLCVKDAALAMLNVCGFVSFFGVLLRASDEIFARLSLPSWLHIPAACLLELGSACGAAAGFGGEEGILLAGAAVGFTGFCVILQEKALCPELSVWTLVWRRVYMSALTVAFTLFLKPLFGI